MIFPSWSEGFVQVKHVVVEWERKPLEDGRSLPLGCHPVTAGRDGRSRVNPQIMAKKRTVSEQIASADGNHEWEAKERTVRELAQQSCQPAGSSLLLMQTAHHTRRRLFAAFTTEQVHP